MDRTEQNCNMVNKRNALMKAQNTRTMLKHNVCIRMRNFNSSVNNLRENGALILLMYSEISFNRWHMSDKFWKN